MAEITDDMEELYADLPLEHGASLGQFPNVSGSLVGSLRVKEERIYNSKEAEKLPQERRLQILLEYNGMSAPVVIGTLSKENGSYVADNLYTLEGKRLQFPVTVKSRAQERVKNVKQVPSDCSDKALARIRITVADEKSPAIKASPFYLWQEPNSNVEILEALPKEFIETFNGSFLISSSLYNAAKSGIEKELAQVQENANQIKLQMEHQISSLQLQLSERGKELVALEGRRTEAQNALEDLLQEKTSLESDQRHLQKVAKEKFAFLRSCGLISGEHFITLTEEVVRASEVDGETISWREDLKGEWSLAVSAIHSYFIEMERVIYPRWMVANFLTLLRTGDLVILSGLSGSGKTQLVRSTAKALGGVAHIIPVKPNWTGPEDLLGFFNPLQRTYVKTPFLEALLAAQRDPERLHLICLDEMNLARAEYYFADFLSELENRCDPSVKLYSESEKDHVLAELRLLFALSGNLAALSLDQDEVPVAVLEELFAGQKENLPFVHDRLRRAVATVLDVPPQLPIPRNVRFIGAINVDQTTFGLSPKILDRAHVVRFENPLLYNVAEIKESALSARGALPQVAPIAMRPDEFTPLRTDYPEYDSSHPAAQFLRQIYLEYLQYLGIDVGYRSIRQAQAYWDLVMEVFAVENREFIAKSLIVQQKILPRFTIDGKVKTHKQGQEKERRDIVKEMEQDIRDEALRCGFKPNMHSELQRIRISAESVEKIFNYWA